MGSSKDWLCKEIQHFMFREQAATGYSIVVSPLLKKFTSRYRKNVLPCLARGEERQGQQGWEQITGRYVGASDTTYAESTEHWELQRLKSLHIPNSPPEHRKYCFLFIPKEGSAIKPFCAPFQTTLVLLGLQHSELVLVWKYLKYEYHLWKWHLWGQWPKARPSSSRISEWAGWQQEHLSLTEGKLPHTPSKVYFYQGSFNWHFE